ncbi:MAG: N-methyl-L-tryptophan oxidase [Acidobacteria bacterium]|nr:N-methyl-L-tryptophan oxidase [Acidobacteriota bacterium]
MLKFDVIILGAGAMGSAAFYTLAQMGKKVLLLEQFEIAHSKASTHGESRIFRFAYTNLAYAELAFQCKDMWLKLEKDAKEKLLVTLGGIDFAEDNEDHHNVLAVKNALQALGSNYEELNHNQLTKRYPQFSFSESVKAVYSPDTGVINPTKAIKSMVQCAIKSSATIVDNEIVQEIIPSLDSVKIITSKNQYIADKLIITSGAWTNKLLRYFDLNLPLQVSQEQTVYFRPLRNKNLFTSDKSPVWINYQKDIVYGIPSFDEIAIKVGFHHSGIYLNVDEYQQKPNQEIINNLREYLKKYIPDLAGESFGATTCLYTTTPDHDFIVDLMPNYPNIAIAAGFSGHGFKFAIGIGKALADLIIHNKTDMKIRHLAITRFLT